jgi:hypothetical protein
MQSALAVVEVVVPLLVAVVVVDQVVILLVGLGLQILAP